MIRTSFLLATAYLLSIIFFTCEAFTGDVPRVNLHRLSIEARTSLFSSKYNLEPVSSHRSYVKGLNKVLTGVLAVNIIGLKSANAGLFQSNEQDAVDEIVRLRTPIRDLLGQLTPQMLPNAVGVYIQTQVLKGSKEDCDVVSSYLEIYIKPLQVKMSKTAPLLKLSEQKSQERLEILPSLMMGHIFELKQAIDERKVENQLREVQEVVETLDEFLDLASVKYNVPAFTSSYRAASDAELFGPFGCGFWGKKRVPGSNACTE